MEKSLSIGNLLKRGREKKKISLEELADTTKININILRALEYEDVSQLPNKTYVKGFVKNYAKTVGISIDEALQALEGIYNSDDESASESVEKFETYEDKEAKVELEDIQDSLRGVLTSIFNKKIFISIAAVLVLYIIGKGVFSFFMTLSQEQKSMTDQKAEIKEIKKDEIIKSQESSLFEMESTKKLQAENKETEKVAQEKVNQQDQKTMMLEREKLKRAAVVKKETTEQRVEKVDEVVEFKKPVQKTDVKEEPAKEEDEEKEEVVKLPPGTFPYKNFYPAPTNMYSILEDAPENTNTELLPANIKNARAAGLENVYIRATNEDTWLSYQVDDQDIKRFVLKKGRAILIQGKTVLLFMGNVNATHIFYNNKLINAPTKTGVKSLIFPESAAKDYELPLFPSYKGVPYSQRTYKEKMAEKPNA